MHKRIKIFSVPNVYLKYKKNSKKYGSEYCREYGSEKNKLHFTFFTVVTQGIPGFILVLTDRTR